MKYISCKLCNAVMEGNAVWQFIDKMFDHITDVHPDIEETIEADSHRYQREREPLEKALGKIKEPIRHRDFLMIETMLKKEGRKEFEGKIIRFEPERRKHNNYWSNKLNE